MERTDFTRGAIVDEEECIAALDAYLARYPSPVLALVRAYSEASRPPIPTEAGHPFR